MSDSLPFTYNSYCKTEITESDMYTFVWEIANFSSRTEENGEYLDSEQFSVNGPGIKKTKWSLRIYPRNQKSKDSDIVAVFLRNNSDVDVQANYAISTLVAKGVKQLGVAECVVIKANRGNGDLSLFNRSKDLLKFVPEDSLTILVDVTVLGDTNKFTKLMRNGENSLSLPSNYHHRQLGQDLGKLFDSKDHADVTLACGTREIKCHKMILTLRSPVFKTMFESNMKEKYTDRVEIKNMKTDVLEDLLQYIYTGDAPNVSKHAKELFAAAEQYQLENLRELCEASLCSNISKDDCIELLILADLHQASALKNAALKFLSKYMKELKTSEWKKKLMKYPALLAEVVESLLLINMDCDIKKRASS